jgi:hypothetical protein
MFLGFVAAACSKPFIDLPSWYGSENSRRASFLISLLLIYHSKSRSFSLVFRILRDKDRFFEEDMVLEIEFSFVNFFKILYINQLSFMILLSMLVCHYCYSILSCYNRWHSN